LLQRKKQRRQDRAKTKTNRPDRSP
jgi:hypothetical protein